MKARSRRSRQRPAPPARAAALTRFRRDEGGQITFIALFGAVAFVGLLGLVVSTGDQAGLKIEMQNTADAAALSGGAWVARGLNVISALNVAETQLVSGALLLNALEETLRYSKIVVQIQNKAYAACMSTAIGAAFCAIPFAITTAQLIALNVLEPAVKALANTLSKCDNGVFWVVARALEKVNEAVHYSFFAIAFAETASVAKANRAELAVLLPGPLFHAHLGLDNLTLPTEKKEFPVMCDPMDRGSPEDRERGYHILLRYDTREGPFRLGKKRLKIPLWALTGVPPVGPFVFDALADAQKRTVCEGAAWTPPKVTQIREDPDLAACRAHGGQAEWTFMAIRTRTFDQPLANPQGFFDAKLPKLPAQAPANEAEAKALQEKLKADLQALKSDPDIQSVEEGGPFWRSCSWTPPGTVKKSPTVYQKLETQVLGFGKDRKYRYSLLLYVLNRTRFEVTETVGQSNPLGGECTPPKPFLLREGWEEDDALRYLVVARRPNRRIFFSPEFLEEPPELYTYAQVEVYNGISDDTFTQDWRVRLDHASLLSVPFESMSGAGLGGLFPAFAGRYLGQGQGFDLAKYLWQVNNH